MRLLTLALLLASSTAHAGAWTKDLGEHFVSFNADYYVPTRWENPVSGPTSASNFLGQQYSLYGEVGLLPWHPLQLTASVPLKVTTLSFPVEDAVDDALGRARSTRPGDLRLALQTQIYRGSVSLSGGVEVKIPMYRGDKIGADYGTYTDIFPFPGDAQIDVTPMLSLGGSVGRVFLELNVGYRFRTEAFIGYSTPITFVDGVPFLFKTGVTLGPTLLMFETEGIKNVAVDPYTRENVSLALSGLFTVHKGLAFSARVSREVWANNAAQGLAWGAGISWRSL